jgi:ribulose-5-phosphate 4-epimerase/fuculose-1-phosphate aldolase
MIAGVNAFARQATLSSLKDSVRRNAGNTMEESRLREEMAALGASLFARGYSPGSGGNMSAKLTDGSILSTPANSCLGRLAPARLSMLAADGTPLSGDPPSKECAFHLKIYEARPECGAIVHLHSTYAAALSCCRDIDGNDAMRPFTPYYAMKVAPLPLVPYCKPGSPELAAAVASKAREAKCLLLANHGPVVTGKTLEDAVNTAEELEETAKLFFILRGNPAGMRYLTGEQIRELVPGP